MWWWQRWKDSNSIDLFRTIGDTVTSSRINHVCCIFTRLLSRSLSTCVFFMLNKFDFSYAAPSAPSAVIITVWEVFTNDSAIIYISSPRLHRYLHVVVVIGTAHIHSHRYINKREKQTQSVQISVMKNWSRHLMSPSFSLISRCLSHSCELFVRLLACFRLKLEWDSLAWFCAHGISHCR